MNSTSPNNNTTGSNLSARAIKRALRDLAEIEANPISGISVAMPDINNPFVMHANIEIRDGIYEGILIHLVIHIPDEYPIKPPAVNIAPGLDFGHKYHEHIYDNQTHGNSICTDLTSNFAGHFSLIDSYGKPTRSGWTPSYTLSSVLVQLQVFFADPDLEKHMLPSDEEIVKLRRHIERFEVDVKIDDGMGEEKTVTHSRRNPYPPLSCEVVKAAISEEEKTEEVEMVKPIEMTNHKASRKHESNANGQNSYFSSFSTAVKTQGQSQSAASNSVDESSFEELKESVISTLKSTEPQKTSATTSEWGKPLIKKATKFKAVSSEEKLSLLNVNSKTQLGQVMKPIQDTNVKNGQMNDPSRGKISYNAFNNKNESFSNHRNTTYNYSYERRPTSSLNLQSKSYNTNDNSSIEFNSQRSTNKNGKFNLQSSISKAPRKPQTYEIFQPNYNLIPTDYSNFYGGLASTKFTNELIQIGQSEIAESVKRQETSIDKSSIFATENVYPPGSATPKQIRNQVRDKLVCSVTKVDVFDDSKPVLGYPIDIKKDAYGRLWPIPIMEILSYDAFVLNIQQNSQKLDNYARVKFTSSFGSSYNYWLPIYIDDEHFERGKEHIFNAISIIYSGVEGKRDNDFRPEMALKVLPPILVKTAVNFLNGNIYQSIVGIDAYCHIYQLLVKMVKMFPELQKIIDQEVQDFCVKEDNRHKEVAGDLGEFMIKLSLSSRGLTNSLARSFIFKEHMARQVSWNLKKDRGLLYSQRDYDFVERFLTASQVSNQFALVKLEIAKLLQDSNVMDQLEKQRGVLSEETIRIFRSRMNWIQKHVIGDWKVLVEGLEQEESIYSEEMMRREIVKAITRARVKGYLAFK